MPRMPGGNRAEPRWARRWGRRRVAGARRRGAGGVWAGAVGAVGEARCALRSERDGLRQEMRGFAPRGIRRMDGGAAVGVAHAKTKVEVGVFHVKHLYADKPHLRSARMHGPSALAGKLRVPSGDPRPELEVSGGGVQTGVQTEVRAACAGCGRALPQSPSGGGGSFSPLVRDNASRAPSGASLAIANRTLRATLRPRWRAPPNGSAHGASAQRAGVALHLGVLATGGVSLRPCIFALRMHLASRGQRASCAVRVSPLSFFAVDTYQPKV